MNGIHKTMRKHTMIYEPFDVVVVPFPFTDSAQTKRRPALVLSQCADFGNKIDHSVLAMITSRKNAPWPLDCEITNKKKSGLTAPSVVRMKLFTLDNRFIIRKIGQLSDSDQKKVKQSLSQLFDYL
jgi:mRNA interferase MazF